MDNAQGIKRPEILSPAGGMPALRAALDAGADAVYGGLKQLNARTGAANFQRDELKTACDLVHEKGAKFYLTLNTDLAQRELGQAARSLAVAVECGVDAVLIRDPAILELRKFFPSLQLHFSTQAGISSSAGVLAAKELHLARVVLARELSLEEIQATTNHGMEIEIFVQGALCFSCSGRCLLSSWGGGRSGNRGACTSPCRLLWSDKEGNLERTLSMHDLCVLPDLPAIFQTGVESLKIEGRLKSPEWVHSAVSLYRKALDAPTPTLSEEAEALGNYTGRQLTDGYLHGIRTSLTGDSRRTASAAPLVAVPQPQQEHHVQCTVEQDEKGALLFHFQMEEQQTEERIPPQRIVNAKRALKLSELMNRLFELTPDALRPTALWAFPSDCLLTKSAANTLCDSYSAWLRKLMKEDDGTLKGVSLPEGLSNLLAGGRPSPKNNRALGSAPDTIRHNWNESPEAVPTEPIRRIVHIFPQTIEEAEIQFAAAKPDSNVVIALPQVIYEGQLPAIRHAMRLATTQLIPLELNSWDEWWLARQEHARFLAGEGLHILNALAASTLEALGFENTLVSCEIDKMQLETLCAAVSTPISITVFSRPPLMITRAEIPLNSPLTERRGTTLLPTKEGPVTVLRPSIPMDWRNLHNGNVRAEHLILDLRGTPSLPPPQSSPFLFNYDRRLR